MKQLIFSIVAMLFSFVAVAQQSWVNEVHNPQANTEGLAPMGARVISPEVHDDHTVTFRLYAPNAKEVVVRGTMFTLPHFLGWFAPSQLPFSSVQSLSSVRLFATP